jgi:hypothetical protein
MVETDPGGVVQRDGVRDDLPILRGHTVVVGEGTRQLGRGAA